MTERTKIVEGNLKVSEIMSRTPVTVPTGTPLNRVLEVLTGGHSRHLLVTDTRGSVIGVVSEHDLLSRVAEWEAQHNTDWRQKPVEAVMVTKFVSGSPDVEASDLAALLADGGIACLPIIDDNKLVGVMTPNDLLVSWSRLHPVLQQAGCDSLTGLANRATFDRRLGEELARARRFHTPLSLILIDVDYFKQINDSCGHLTGDAVLRTMAARYHTLDWNGGAQRSVQRCHTGASFSGCRRVPLSGQARRPRPGP